MPKMKTDSGAKKRIKVTGSGKLRRRKAFRGHLMEKKSSVRARRLGRETDLPKALEKKTSASWVYREIEEREGHSWHASRGR